MKKTAMIVSCALLGFACVFARENRAAGQGKVAGARAKGGAQAKKAPAAEAPLPQIDKEKICPHVKYLSSGNPAGAGARGQRCRWRRGVQAIRLQQHHGQVQRRAFFAILDELQISWCYPVGIFQWSY